MLVHAHVVTVFPSIFQGEFLLRIPPSCNKSNLSFPGRSIRSTGNEEHTTSIEDDGKRCLPSIIHMVADYKV